MIFQNIPKEDIENGENPDNKNENIDFPNNYRVDENDRQFNYIVVHEKTQGFKSIVVTPQKNTIQVHENKTIFLNNVNKNDKSKNINFKELNNNISKNERIFEILKREPFEINLTIL